MTFPLSSFIQAHRFRLAVMVRLVLLVATLCGFLALFHRGEQYVAIVLTGLLALVQLVWLFYYLEWTNHELKRFLEAVRYADFSQTFHADGLGSSFEELNRSMTKILEIFNRFRSEKEEQNRYLQMILQHGDIGLMTFRQDGSVDLINKAAKQLLQVSRLTMVEELASVSRHLVETLTTARPGDRHLVRIQTADGLRQLALNFSEFKLGDRLFRLVSLQDIRGELEEKEMESWQVLIRVLTHEIMNSMTPISSLSATADGLIEQVAEGSSLPEECRQRKEIIEDLRVAIKTIQKRSLGLMDFVTAYRNLTLIPKPKFKVVSVQEIFSRVTGLMNPMLEKNGITLTTSIEPTQLEITADPGLIEQVLINLLLNAVDALNGRSDGQVEMTARISDLGKTLIQVSDNGPGIVEDALDKVFIPFWTTKKSGSGIGLSFSRQVLRLHQGTISVQSMPEHSTCFTLML